MDVQLQDLIERIKKDGVATAEKQAAQIIDEAQKKSEEIISDAESKAAEIIKSAKAETERMEKSSEEAITQAGRNMLLSFKDSLVQELDLLIQAETSKALSTDILKTLVPEVVKEWSKKNDASELSVLLSEKDLKDLNSAFTQSLKDEIAKGLEVKPDKTMSAGFRIGVKNGSAYYDYSSESLAEMFAAYLNPKVAGLMKDAAKDAQ
ncbi:MAG: V-type ATP synthase subunit E [Treponema sp.]|nr:V-type ATP synthase subunit E [Treponema sp.]